MKPHPPKRFKSELYVLYRNGNEADLRLTNVDEAQITHAWLDATCMGWHFACIKRNGRVVHKLANWHDPAQRQPAMAMQFE